MIIEPSIIWIPSGFSGYIWFDTKIVLKQAGMQACKQEGRQATYGQAGRRTGRLGHKHSIIILSHVQNCNIL